MFNLELQESTPLVLPLTPTKSQPKKQIPAGNKDISNFNGHQSTKTDEDLLKNLPDFTSMFKNAIQSSETHISLSNDKFVIKCL